MVSTPRAANSRSAPSSRRRSPIRRGRSCWCGSRAGGRLAPSVAPGLTEIGSFLPYSPLHHLLLSAFGGPVIATSGNVSGEPVLTDPAEAETRLAQVADAFLHHDRPIVRPADDSVVRVAAGRPRPIRLGRGLAPLELELPASLPEPVLAVGGHLKLTVALAWDRRIVVSPHIGDMGTLRSEQVFEQVTRDLQRLYDVEARHWLCDAHPGYTTTRWVQAHEQSALDRAAPPCARVGDRHGTRVHRARNRLRVGRCRLRRRRQPVGRRDLRRPPGRLAASREPAQFPAAGRRQGGTLAVAQCGRAVLGGRRRVPGRDSRPDRARGLGAGRQCAALERGGTGLRRAGRDRARHRRDQLRGPGPDVPRGLRATGHRVPVAADRGR